MSLLADDSRDSNQLSSFSLEDTTSKLNILLAKRYRVPNIGALVSYTCMMVNREFECTVHIRPPDGSKRVYKGHPCASKSAARKSAALAALACEIIPIIDDETSEVECMTSGEPPDCKCAVDDSKSRLHLFLQKVYVGCDIRDVVQYIVHQSDSMGSRQHHFVCELTVIPPTEYNEPQRVYLGDEMTSKKASQQSAAAIAFQYEYKQEHSKTNTAI